MRIRSLGLAIACGLALTASYPAGKPAAQVTVQDQRRQRFIGEEKSNNALFEHRARRALARGNCGLYQVYRSGLEHRADPQFWRGLPDIGRQELAEHARLVLDSLPAICDPDPFIRSQLERDAHSTEVGGGEDAD